MKYSQKLLFTPGPLSTTMSVKEAMLVDLGTRDIEYQNVTKSVREKLLKIALASKEEFSVVLLQGSGTYAVESVLNSFVSANDKLLILANGAYGDRMAQIATMSGLNFEKKDYSMIKSLDLAEVEKAVSESDATIVSFVHDETTAGVLNDIKGICDICRRYNKKIICDAMSSFGGIEINLDEVKPDFLVTSSNKCIQGVPGFGIIYGRREAFEACKGNSKSLALDLYDQWKYMEDTDGGFRFTSPTHVLLAFDQALDELEAEGGIPARAKRYRENQKFIAEKMTELGFELLVDPNEQAPMITTLLVPEGLDFADMYEKLKAKGFLLYSGKLPKYNAFRIGNIGDLHAQDFIDLAQAVKEYLEEAKK